MDLQYTVVYSNRSTFGITVERDRSIVVRAPLRATPEHIEEVVNRRKLWIYEKLHSLRKYCSTEHHSKECVSGTSVLYLGESYLLDVDDSPEQGIRFDGGSFRLNRRVCPKAGQLFETWYRAQARERIGPIVEEFAAALGVHYRSILISDLRYRWGSCTPNDNLNFNWRLVKAPLQVIRYVVVHELVHLLEPNHTPHFWKLVFLQLPRYERAKNWLKMHGEELESDF